MEEGYFISYLDVISNITVVNSYNCPEGFQTYSGYNWPGIKQGCYCYAQIGTWDFIKVLEVICSLIRGLVLRLLLLLAVRLFNNNLHYLFCFGKRIG